MAGIAINRLGLLAALLLVAFRAPTSAQVVEVTVGVTPRCPYGLEACWGVASEGLRSLKDVDSIAAHPDAYNCTANVTLKHEGLPDLDKWPDQFADVVGEMQLFRGVELTVKGTVESQGELVTVTVPGLHELFSLAPLRQKLQWNFKKKAYREPEPSEAAAYQRLAAELKTGQRLKVEATGPFRRTESGPVLEVREYYLLD